MSLRRQHAKSIVAVLALAFLVVLLSFAAATALAFLVVLLSFAAATDGQNAHGISFALVSLALQLVFALPLVSFWRAQPQFQPVTAPFLFQQFGRPPPASS